LRENAHARRVVKGMMEAGKLVAIVGDAVEMLVAAEAARGRKVTGAEASRARVEAMGAVWSEAPLTVDGNLVTTASSEDLEGLIAAVIDSLVAAPEGERQQAA
ncbi:MAG: DJ-1/PfpI family protein, partial [Alphaproteobacteria bacterium]|nr:DJ-1/PfpI family protein [Alphaproteobacteria bacterium]